MKTYAVYVGFCSEYDPQRIAEIIRRALDAIPLRKLPSGNVVIKPNLVMAHPKVATETYTRKEVIEGILRVVRERGRNVRRIDIAGKSGLGVTTASMFRWAGYGPTSFKQIRIVGDPFQKGRLHQGLSPQPQADRLGHDGPVLSVGAAGEAFADH